MEGSTHFDRQAILTALHAFSNRFFTESEKVNVVAFLCISDIISCQEIVHFKRFRRWLFGSFVPERDFGMRFIISAFIIFFGLSPAFAQEQDSLSKAAYQRALRNLDQKAFSTAEDDFSQLIAAGFAYKEVLVKRGISRYHQKNYDGAREDFDNAVRARVNTAELF